MPTASLLLLPLLALCIAMVLPVQAAINAQLSRAIGSPLAATAISFGAGAMLMTLVTLAWQRQFPIGAMLRQPWWMLLGGGALGVCYVLGNIVLVTRLGATALFTFAIAGQLIAALLLDQFGVLGIAVREASLGRVAGIALVVVGAVMARVL